MDNANVTDERLVDNEESYWWLKLWDIKAETESTIVAAQGRAVSINYFKYKILKKEIDCIFLLCKQHEETIDHLTSGCPILEKNKYFMRHNKVCAHLHYSICKALRIEKKQTNGACAASPTNTHGYKTFAKFLILNLPFSRLTKVLLFTDSL